MGSHNPFGHLKHKLWLKKGPGIKLAVRLPTTKSRESTRLPCVQVVCDIALESSRRGLQICFKYHLNQRSACKVMGPHYRRSPNSQDKMPLDVGLVERHKVYYKGEGCGFPQVEAVLSLVNPNLPMTRPSTKSASTMH
jgi:hypothetical protein